MRRHPSSSSSAFRVGAVCACVVVVSFAVAFAVCLSVCLCSRVTWSYLGPDENGLLECEVARCL